MLFWYYGLKSGLQDVIFVSSYYFLLYDIVPSTSYLPTIW